MHAAVTSSGRTHALTLRPHHVAPALVLSIAAGCVCGWNLTFSCLATAALLFNCPLWLLASAFAGGCALAAFCTPLTHAVGVFLLDKLELGAILADYTAGPIGALFRLDEFHLVGGLATGLVVGVPAAHALARLICGRSTKALDGSAIGVGLLRPRAALVLCCCVAVTAATTHVQTRRLAGAAFLKEASAALDAELTADRVEFGLWNGELRIQNLRVVDNEHPGRTALLVETVEAQTDPGLFLRGRLHCSEVKLIGLLSDSSRSSLDRVGVFSGGPTILSEDVPNDSHNAEPSRAVELQGLIKPWSSLGDRPLLLQTIVAAVERIADLETPAAANVRRAADRRCSSAGSQPLVQIKRLTVERLPAAWRLSSGTRCELAHLTSRPRSSQHGATLVFEDTARAMNLEIAFHLDGAERRHDAALSIDDVDAADMLSATNLRGSLEFGGARFASIAGRGFATRDQLELNLCATMKDFNVAAEAGPIAGIAAPVWRQCLAYLGEFRLDAKTAGRYSQLKLTLVPSAAVEQFKHQLRAAGAHDLVKTVEAASRAEPAAALSAAKSQGGRPLAPPADVLPPTPATSLPQAAAAPSPLAAATAQLLILSDAAAAKQTDVASAGPQTVKPLTEAADKPVVPTGAPTSIATSISTSTPAAAIAAKEQAKPISDGTPAKPVDTAKPDDAVKPVAQAKTPAPTVGSNPPLAAYPNTASKRPAIGIASDSDLVRSDLDADAEPAKPAAATPAAPKPDVAKAPATKPAVPNVASNIPARLPEVELRQPLSVLNPNTRPGPVNMSVGYTEERVEMLRPSSVAAAAASRPAAQASVATKPQAAASRPTTKPQLPPTTARMPLTDARPPLAEERPTPASAPQSENKTEPQVEARTELAAAGDDAPKPKRRGYQLPERHGNPATLPKQSASAKGNGGLFGQLGLFGGKKPAEETAVEQPTPEMQIEDVPPEAAQAPAPSKKMFPRLRAMFFSEEEEVETDYYEGSSADYDDAPYDDRAATGAVRPSSFNAPAGEPPRTATPTSKSYSSMPRELVEDVPSAEPRATPRAERAAATAPAAQDEQPAARMSARESFYERIVR